MADHRYRVRYDVALNPDGWTKAELGERGGCDKLILISIMESETGGRSEALIGIDGLAGTNISDIDLFKSWVGLAYQLMTAEGITEEARAVAAEAFRTVQLQVLDGR